MEFQHFSHEHPLVLRTDVDECANKTVSCFACTRRILGPYYTCENCDYDLHDGCFGLPMMLQHFLHPYHILHLRVGSNFTCRVCHEYGKGFVYSCIDCLFDVELKCTIPSDMLEINRHQPMLTPTCLSSSFSWHIHPLVLTAKEHKPRLTDEKEVTCDGCSEPIAGPTYSCELQSCGYNLHKVCAELPIQMNHPMHHPQHMLTLSEEPPLSSSSSSYGPYRNGRSCAMCGRNCDKVFYNCHYCKFNVDLLCASASHQIQDKCHQHPLIPIQLPLPFLCHICGKYEEGVSYRCTTCPFWVHQNCTLLPTRVNHRDHVHQLTLLDSIPSGCHINFNFECDICHANLTTFGTIFTCVGCLFFAHPGCAMSSDFRPLTFADYFHVGSSFSSRKYRVFLKEQDWTYVNLIAIYVEGIKYLSAPEIKHWSHRHKLSLHIEAGKGKNCDKCKGPISGYLYGCTECSLYIHIWCAEPNSSYFYGKHNFNLLKQKPGKLDFFRCNCCLQLCNSFSFRCKDREFSFTIDFKCGNISKMILHQGHRHGLTPRADHMSTCNACGDRESPYKMKCYVCHFHLCFPCAMLPPVINHRHCKHGLKLQYSPIEKYTLEYICDYCENALLPKYWFYHCGKCELFAHPPCLTECIGGSDIAYGKRYNLPDHEHMLTLTSFMHVWSRCKVCGLDLNRGFTVGLECGTCEFKIHLKCVKSFEEQLAPEYNKYMVDKDSGVDPDPDEA